MWSMDFKHLKEDHGNGQFPVELGNSSQPQCGLNQSQASQEVDKVVDGALHIHPVGCACLCAPQPVRVTLVRSHCHHLRSQPTLSLGLRLSWSPPPTAHHIHFLPCSLLPSHQNGPVLHLVISESLMLINSLNQWSSAQVVHSYSLEIL